MLLSGSPHKTQDAEQNHSTDERHKNACKVQACDCPTNTERIQNKAAEEAADDTNNNIGNQTLTRIGLHNNACQPAGNTPNNNPGNKISDSHFNVSTIYLTEYPANINC